MPVVVDAPARDGSSPPRLGLLSPVLAARLSALVRAFPASVFVAADAAHCWRIDPADALADLDRLTDAGWTERTFGGRWVLAWPALLFDVLPDLLDAAPAMLDVLPEKYEHARLTLSHLINRSNNR